MAIDFKMDDAALAEAAAEVAPQFNAFRAEVEANQAQEEVQTPPPPVDDATEQPQWPADEGAPQEPPPVLETPPEPVGHSLTQDEYDRYLIYKQLDERLRTDSAFAERFRTLDDPAQPQQYQPASPPAPVRPDAQYADSYLTSDPAWQQMSAQMAEQQRVINQLSAIVSDQRKAENDATRLVVERTFKERHGLDDKQFRAVYDNAQSYAGMMPALAAKGVPVNEALEQVLDAAYWSMPEMREMEWHKDAERRKADQTRKAKAGSLSGSSGSVPRTATVDIPKTEQGRRDAMTKLAGQLMNGEME